MNLRLMLDIRRLVLAEPESVDMRVYERERGCGTANCIAGKAVRLSGYVGTLRCSQDIDVVGKATEVLGLSETEANWLFYFHTCNFPDSPYQDLCARLGQHWPGERAYAEIVAEAIDRCIDRNKPDELLSKLLMAPGDVLAGAL